MTWPTDVAQVSLERIAKEAGVAIHWSEDHPQAFWASMTVIVPSPTTGGRYLTALHEIGHLVDTESRGWWDHSTSALSTLMCESAAWTWAALNMDHALIHRMRRADWNDAAHAWRSYLEQAAQDRLV